MNENIRTEAENRKIGWYFVIFSGKERPAYFDGKNWIVWGNMGFWNDSDLSKISDRLIPYFHAQQLEKSESEIIAIAEFYDIAYCAGLAGHPMDSRYFKSGKETALSVFNTKIKESQQLEKDNSTMFDVEILFYAFRYALGRQTYAVSDVAKKIINNWSKIDNNTKLKINKEINEAIEKGRAGAEMDVSEWQKILELSLTTQSSNY